MEVSKSLAVSRLPLHAPEGWRYSWPVRRRIRIRKDLFGRTESIPNGKLGPWAIVSMGAKKP